MKRNFRIDNSGVELIMDGMAYDAHNRYDYRHTVFWANASITLCLMPNAKWGAGLPYLTLRFAGVDYVQIGRGFGESRIDGIDEIGFKAPEDQDDDWLDGETFAAPESHLFIRFVGGCFLRVHAAAATLETGKRGCLCRDCAH